MRAYVEFGFDLRPDDVYWCAADPGWAYGLFYAVLGPLCLGARSILLHAGLAADLTCQVLDRFQVTNFAAAPTIYRALRASGIDRGRASALRCASSAGEPLTPEVNQWAPGWLGVEVHDHYGQTETGMLVNNHHQPSLRRPLRAGSMGQEMPGWRAVVLDNERDEPVNPGTVGRIAMDLTASPLAWFKGYENDPARTAEKISADGRWYLTGDSGSMDADGYFYFSARDDDVIIMAGYRIGPFEVESVLSAHPAVAECAVIAAPDEMRGEVIEAFVTLRPSPQPLGLAGCRAAAMRQGPVRRSRVPETCPLRRRAPQDAERQDSAIRPAPATSRGQRPAHVLRGSRQARADRRREAGRGLGYHP
jgi:acetyl-CoA synthetase